MPILYSFVRCPYAIRARMALHDAGIDYELREVDLKNKPAAMLKISPKATVPVLLLEDGGVIDESLDIIYYALKGFNDKGRDLIEANDREFVKLFRPYKYPDRHPEYSKEVCKQEIQDKFLDKYEIMLEGKAYLYGEKSIADIAILPFVRQFAIVDEEWFYNSKYKNIINWLKSFIDKPDFKNIIMAKHKIWVE